VAGVISPREHGWPMYVTERMEDVVIIILLPLYFTVSGLNTNLRELNDGVAISFFFFFVPSFSNVFLESMGNVYSCNHVGMFRKDCWVANSG